MQSVNVSCTIGQKSFAEFDIVVKCSLKGEEVEYYKQKEGVLELFDPFRSHVPTGADWDGDESNYPKNGASTELARTAISSARTEWEGLNSTQIEGLILSSFSKDKKAKILGKKTHKAIPTSYGNPFELWKKQQSELEKIRRHKEKALREERKRRK